MISTNAFGYPYSSSNMNSCLYYNDHKQTNRKTHVWAIYFTLNTTQLNVFLYFGTLVLYVMPVCILSSSQAPARV